MAHSKGELGRVCDADKHRQADPSERLVFVTYIRLSRVVLQWLRALMQSLTTSTWLMMLSKSIPFNYRISVSSLSTSLCNAAQLSSAVASRRLPGTSAA